MAYPVPISDNASAVVLTGVEDTLNGVASETRRERLAGFGGRVIENIAESYGLADDR